MIFEWYSGSDKTLEIPKRLRAFEETKETLSLAERVHALRQMLTHEQDGNWKGVIAYMMGEECLHEGQEGEARHWFSEAIRSFVPRAANFRDVAEEYCRTAYRLAELAYSNNGPAEEVLELSTRAILGLGEPWLYKFEKYLLLRMLGGAVNDLGKKTGCEWAYSVASNFYWAAHHIDPEEPGLLEALLYCHFNLRQYDDCHQIFRMFAQVADRYEHRARVEDFYRRSVEPHLP